MDSVFARVKEAIKPSAEALLREFGVERKGNHAVSWSQEGWSSKWVCPLCDDTSGSASFTRELFLHCHQCGTKKDVFEWLAGTPWQVCQKLADRLNVSTKLRRTQRKNMPARMTQDVLNTAIHDLWESDHAKEVRDFLQEREICEPHLLAELGVGFIQGYLVFAQFDERGKLLDRYRGYMPGGHVKWMWFGKGSGGPAMWPHRPVRDGETIFLMEGEHDVLTALVRLRLPDPVFTWTAGAGACPHPRLVPRDWHGKAIHIFYDNDVFQGPDYDNYYWPDEKAKRKVTQLRHNLLENLAPMLASLNCEVTIRQVPIRPEVQLGADFRDWVNKGGRDLKDWPSHSLEELPRLLPPVEDVTFDEAFDKLHRNVRLRTQVEMISGDDLVIPTLSKLECPMGQHSSCNACPATRLFPDKTVIWSEWQRELAVALTDREPWKVLMQSVVGRPRGCPQAELITIESITGSEWHGVRPSDQESSAQRRLHILSSSPPALSGDVEVRGRVYPANKSVVIMADKVEALDRADVDIKPFEEELRYVCPVEAKTTQEIDEYLTKRWHDLSYNVTKVFGRKDIQIAHDLLAHSTMELPIDGTVRRGWLDICVYGDTRSGKSQTFNRMFEHQSLGTYHTAVNNISRTGLVMGADKQGRLKPGLFPKSNRKMLTLDEWHFLCQQVKGAEHPMSWLQSARDEGRVSGIKLYGDRALMAKVRFAAISNWTYNRRDHFEHDCEHLLYLYGSPEALARLDFGLVVTGSPSEPLRPTAQFWDKEKTKALALRAWAQTADDVTIEDEALKMAAQQAKDWKALYAADELPLYTPEEKEFSILRIAAAVANLCFSHSDDSLYDCYVTPVHVQWAIQWLSHTWSVSGYDKFSENYVVRRAIDKPLEVEQMLVGGMGMGDPDYAQIILASFMAPFSIREVSVTLGKDPYEANHWISRARGLKMILARRSGDRWGIEMVLTADGRRIVENLITLCRHHPEGYVERRDRLAAWSAGEMAPQGMVSLTMDEDRLLEDISEQYAAEAEIHEGPGAG
jgi:hypothetical protein